MARRNRRTTNPMPEGCRAYCLDDGSREYLLFHGLPVGVLPLVLTEGFKIIPGKSGSFGSGSYFADLASKADFYSGKTGRGHVKVQLVCRVSLGTMHLEQGRHTKDNYPPAGYDSVVALPRSLGGRVHHLEMVVFHFLQALPVMAIYYEHLDDCECRFCDYCGGCAS